MINKLQKLLLNPSLVNILIMYSYCQVGKPPTLITCQQVVKQGLEYSDFLIFIIPGEARVFQTICPELWIFEIDMRIYENYLTQYSLAFHYLVSQTTKDEIFRHGGNFIAFVYHIIQIISLDDK